MWKFLSRKLGFPTALRELETRLRSELQAKVDEEQRATKAALGQLETTLHSEAQQRAELFQSAHARLAELRDQIAATVRELEAKFDPVIEQQKDFVQSALHRLSELEQGLRANFDELGGKLRGEAERAKALRHAQDQVDGVRQSIAEMQPVLETVKQSAASGGREIWLPVGDSLWFEYANLWEPTVLLAVVDLSKPGDVVFDVGANFGGLTSAMSRLVGPRGVVVSFEASPRIFPLLQRNLIKQGFFNVYPQPRAVFSKSGEELPMYAGDHLNDSLFQANSPSGNAIGHAQTISLDDFISESGLVPSLVKVDVEGAEIDVLRGASALIAKHHPFFILEQQTTDSACLDLLKANGYQIIDLNSYREIRTLDDYPKDVGVRNVLAIHKTRLAGTPYRLPMRIRPLQTFDSSAVMVNGPDAEVPISDLLQPGRYFVQADFSATGIDNEMWCGIKLSGRPVFRYHSYSKLLASSYRDWVFDVYRPAAASAFFSFLKGSSDPTFRVEELKLSQLSDFLPSKLGAAVLTN